jgi:hypothetical protein
MRIHAVTPAGTASAVTLTSAWFTAGSGTATGTTHCQIIVKKIKLIIEEDDLL